jgi:hypothetical protein
MAAANAAHSRDGALVFAVDLHRRGGRPSPTWLDLTTSFDLIARAPLDRMTRAPMTHSSGLASVAAVVCFGCVSASVYVCDLIAQIPPVQT